MGDEIPRPWGRVRVERLWRSEAVRAAIGPYLLSRVGVLLVGAVAVAVIGFPADRTRPRLAENPVANLMARWDAEWYLTIAREGYVWNEDLRTRARLAFMPGYPIASRLLGRLVGDVAIGAALVTATCFWLALIYLYRLAREDLSPSEAAWGVALLAFAPFAVFYSALYTEAMYLFGMVAAIYHFRRAEWVRASMAGLLVGLTRPNGFLLSAVLGVALAHEMYRRHRAGDAVWRGVPGSLVAAAMPTLGTGVFSGYAYAVTGDPLMWLRLHELWGRGQASFWDVIVTRYTWVRDMGLAGYITSRPIDVINSVAGLATAAAIWPVWRRFGPAYGVLIAINLAAPLASGTTLSLARLTCTLFPLFLWLASATSGRRRHLVLIASIVLQACAAVLFFTWRRLY